MECAKCNIKNNDPVLNCDSCNRSVHRDCSDLNASELKVMDLKGKRLLKFYCDDCLQGIKLIPKLLNKIDVMQKEIENLRSEIKNSPPPITHQGVTSNEAIINEICERQKRLNNVMIFNLPETNSVDKDKVEVREICKCLTKEDLEIVKITRFGKKNKNGFRALKISFSQSEDALKVIRAKKDIIKCRKIFIGPDLTPQQIQYKRDLEIELNERRKRGENGVFIKYVKGVPQLAKN